MLQKLTQTLDRLLPSVDTGLVLSLVAWGSVCVLSVGAVILLAP